MKQEALLVCPMSISEDLKFHIHTLQTPLEAWFVSEQLFGKTNLICARQLEIQLISLDLTKLSKIEDYISKFKLLKLQLGDCGITKLDNQAIVIHGYSFQAQTSF
jgi:hypothetical protein